MELIQIKEFAERYLRAYDCHILEKNPDFLQARLSVEADKDLVHRPFYWMYVEKMGLEPNPTILTFVFEPDKAPEGVRAEHLSYGTPRFSQMLRSAQKNGRFIRLYEEPRTRFRSAGNSHGYEPWLAVNYKISSICDRKKDEILHLGIHLRTGDIREQFYGELLNRRWTPKLPAHRHTVSHAFTIPEAVGELEYFLQGYIEHQDLSWADNAMDRLEQELEQIHSFYPEEWRMSDELHAEKKQRIREAVWQYHPRVEVEVVNAGLFYMNP
jgi:hypothetical protein